MKVINKSSSLPTFAQINSDTRGSVKPGKYRLQDLEMEVNKSRIAIENLTHTRAIQGALYNQVEDLQKELHRCILSINQELQKYKVLQQLNTVLKGEMNEVQAIQRTSDEFVSCGIEKKIKKTEYDIKQILHKYNEEIAKINWLKEQANASRDQRVVYSNLFNKIQKEIKHYQEIYKQAVIKNQIFLTQKRNMSIQSNQEMIDFETMEQSTDKCEKIELENPHPITNSSMKDLKPKEYKSIKVIDRQKTPEIDTFITLPKDSHFKHHSAQREHTIYHHKNLVHHREIEALIHQRETTIEAAIVKTQCRSLEEVKGLYGSLDYQNANLCAQITQLDQQIGFLQEEIESIACQKKSTQAYQNRQFTDIANISKRNKSNKAAINDASFSHSQPVKDITKQICEILGVESENLGNEVLRQIDQKIEDLGLTVIKKHEARESHIVSGQDIPDRGIYQLLEKIDRFGESEKIFDQGMLRAEYYKELNKIRKKGKKSS